MFESYPIEVKPMDFGPQRSLYRFRPLQLALQFFNFSIFGLELCVEPLKQDFQFSNVATPREKISLESTVAASAHRPHGVDDFAVRSHQRAVETIAVPQ